MYLMYLIECILLYTKISVCIFLFIYVANMYSIFILNNNKVEQLLLYNYNLKLTSTENIERIKICAKITFVKSLLASLFWPYIPFFLYRDLKKQNEYREYYKYLNIGFSTSPYMKNLLNNYGTQNRFIKLPFKIELSDNVELSDKLELIDGHDELEVLGILETYELLPKTNKKNETNETNKAK